MRPFKTIKIMKKIYNLLLILVGSYSFGQTIFTENFGTPTATTLIPAYATGTAPATFQNGTPIVFTGTGDVRATSVSNTYTGFSGGGNVFLTGTAGKYLQIDGINTSNYISANIQMTFGYLTALFATVQVVLEYSTNASATTPTWTPITFTNNSSNAWALVSIPGGILPSSSSLSLRFTQPTPAGQIRIDDIKVFNFNPACSLVLGNPTALCNAVTSGIDTYTATIPYTGGGTGNYTITPSSGTVGGDNPNSVAAGNITVSGVTEGSNLTLNLVNGVCTYSSTLNAPECKVINTLPFYDGFNYAPQTSLGTSQMWTNVNSGDNILAIAGGLSYPGVTSSGNAVSFSGAGIDCYTPFTSSNSGTIYSAFLLSVTDLSNVTDGNSAYFAALTDDSASKSMKARLFVKRTGTQYSLGFDTNSTTTNFETTLRNINDVVGVIIGYDFTNNTLNSWVNPIPNSGPTFGTSPTTPFTNLGGFILRQDTASTTPTMTFDELHIVTSLSDLGITLSTSTNPSQIAGLNVYPNPVKNGKLYISSESGLEKTVAIYDILGKQVLNTTITNDMINVSVLNAGVYVLKVTESGKSETRKLVIE